MKKPLKDHILSVRFPSDLVEKLRDYAEGQGESVSEVLRRVALSLVTEPIGYRCDHVGIISDPGVIMSVASPCGCVMRKVFEIPDFQKLKRVDSDVQWMI